MSIIKAIIMGIVQGLTEFLPVSSSGHLVIFGQLLDMHMEGSVLFEILLHMGTLVAIIVAFYEDIWALILNGISIIANTFSYLKHVIMKKDGIRPMIIETSYQKFVMQIIVATIPTVIIALVMEKYILEAFGSLLFTAAGLAITATLLLVSMKMPSGKYDADNLSYKRAAVVGVFQGFATFPGVSRSGSTMVAGLMMGMKREFVVKFSFIMSIPAVFGAVILQLKDMEGGGELTAYLPAYGAGVIASALVGYVCIKVLLDIVRKGKLHYFAYYCYAVSILLFVTVIGG